MDYIYGKLNKKVEKQVYKGLTTGTAETYVDNVNSTIRVNITELPNLKETLKELELQQQQLLGEVNDVKDNISQVNTKFNDLTINVLKMKQHISLIDDKLEEIDDKFSKIKPTVIAEEELIDFNYDI